MVSAEVSPEALAKLSKFIEGGPESGCARGCGGCSLAASCRPQTGELVGRIEDLFSKKSPGLREGTFVFGSARQVSGEPPITPIRAKETSEKTCSKCNEDPCTCR